MRLRCTAKNSMLSCFSGLEYGPDGNFRQQEVAKTLDEAGKARQTLRAKFRRRIHPEVLKATRAGFLDNTSRCFRGNQRSCTADWRHVRDPGGWSRTCDERL